jgi:hypothetical protein
MHAGLARRKTAFENGSVVLLQRVVDEAVQPADSSRGPRRLEHFGEQGAGHNGWGGTRGGAAAAVGGCLAWAGRPGLLLGADGNAQGRGMAAGEWDVSLSFNGSRGGGMKADADAERAQVKNLGGARPTGKRKRVQTLLNRGSETSHSCLSPHSTGCSRRGRTGRAGVRCSNRLAGNMGTGDDHKPIDPVWSRRRLACWSCLEYSYDQTSSQRGVRPL